MFITHSWKNIFNTYDNVLISLISKYSYISIKSKQVNFKTIDKQFAGEKTDKHIQSSSSVIVEEMKISKIEK